MSNTWEAALGRLTTMYAERPLITPQTLRAVAARYSTAPDEYRALLAHLETHLGRLAHSATRPGALR